MRTVTYVKPNGEKTTSYAEIKNTRGYAVTTEKCLSEDELNAQKVCCELREMIKEKCVFGF